MSSQSALLANPYVGPRTFARAEANRFFGREREAQDLLALVISQRLVLFYAQSGAGKSSLIHTRLIPQLQGAGFAVLPVGRVGAGLPTDVTAVANIFLFNLMLSLDQGGATPQQLSVLSFPEFLAGLTSEDGEFWRYAPTPLIDKTVIADDSADRYQEPSCVLIIDQFEEIITTHLHRWTERAAFFQALAEAMRRDPKLWVVLTLREDYVAALDPYARFMADKLRARFYMERMEIDAALMAIKNPAANAGRPFTDEAAQMLVTNLSQVRVAGQAETVSGQHVEPVQLQVVCYQLWENLRAAQGALGEQTSASAASFITVADLQQSGDVDTALADFYEQAISSVLALPGVQLSQRQLRAWFEQYLITDARTRGTVYRGATETAGMSNQVVDALQACFLLRTELRAGGAWVELIHDRLIEPIVQANLTWQASYDNPLVLSYQRWEAGGRKVEQLLRGTQLAAATSYATTQPNDVTDAERHFLAESQRQELLEQEQAHQAARRRQITTMTAICVILVLSALTIWAFTSAQRAERNAQATRASALVARAQALQQQDNLLPVSMLLAIEAERANPSAEAKDLLRQGLTLLPPVLFDAPAPAKLTQVAFSPDGQWLASANEDGSVQIREATTGTLIQVLQAESVVPNNVVRDISFDPIDGQRLATASNDGQVCLWQVTTGQRLAPCLVHGQVEQVSFSPDGQWLATAGANGQACLWAATTGAQHFCALHGYPVTDIVFSPSSQWLASADEVGAFQVWAVAGAAKVAGGRQAAAVLALAFSPDNNLASAGSDGTARIWTIDAATATLRELANFRHQSKVNDLAFHPDGKALATVSDDKTVRLWDVDNGWERWRMVHASWTNVVTFSPDGKWLATASVDHTARVWDAATGQEVARLVHENEVRAVAFSPDGRHVATGSTDQTARVWTLAVREESRVQQPGHIWALAYHPTAQQFATTSDEGFRVGLWDTLTGQPVDHLPPNRATARALAFRADGQGLATGSDDTYVRVWQLADKTLPFQLTLADQVRALAFSPDGGCLASGDVDGFVQVHSLAANCAIRPLVSFTDTVTAVTYSAHGQWLAMASRAGWARVESLTAATLITVSHGGTPILAVAFSPDEQWLATAGNDRTARLWQIATGQETVMPLVHGDEVLTVAFSPDGQWLATGSADGTARIWAAATGEEMARLPLNSAVATVLFSPDGHYLLTSSGKLAQVWAFQQVPLVPTQALIDTICPRLTRNLTLTEWQDYLGTASYQRTCPNLAASAASVGTQGRLHGLLNILFNFHRSYAVHSETEFLSKTRFLLERLPTA